MKFKSKRGQTRLARILFALQHKRMTTVEIAETLHMSETSARSCVAHLRKEKQIYVAKWNSIGFTHAAVYAVGSRPDAVKPSATPRPIRRRRCLENLKKDGEKYEFHLARRRALESKPKRDELLFCLFK